MSFRDHIRPILEGEAPREDTICEADGLYIKQISVPIKGTLLAQHSHALSHVTLVTRGAVMLRRGEVFQTEDGGVVYRAGMMVVIPGGELHSFETLEPDTVLYCIHSLASPDALRILAQHGLLE